MEICKVEWFQTDSLIKMPQLTNAHQEHTAASIAMVEGDVATTRVLRNQVNIT